MGTQPAQVQGPSPPTQPGAETLGLKMHTYTMWFKSTLLLFLRLLLSTKKDGLPNLFFSSSRKNRPQRMVYYRFTHMKRRSERTAGSAALGRTSRSPFLEQGGGSFSVKCLVFCCLLCPRPPSRVLPIPDRSVHQGPGRQHRRPLPE